MRKIIVSTAIVTLLQGCTTHLGISSLDDSDDAAVGVPYPLYFDQFAITLNYQLSACGDEPKIKISATVSDPAGKPDPDHIYVVDPDSLSSFMKTSEFELENHADGSPKSLNAKADDKSMEVITSIAKTGVGILKIALAGGGTQFAGQQLCNADTLAAFNKYDAQKGVVSGANDKLKTAQDKFDKEKARIDAAGGAVDPAMQQDFANAYRGLKAATDALDSAKKTLDGLAKKITYSKELRWPSKGTETTLTVLFSDIRAKTFGEWLNVAPQSLDAQPIYDVTIALSSLGPTQLVASKGTATLPASKLAKGIPYRYPTPTDLKITLPNARDDAGKPAPATLYEKEHKLRQLGRVMLLPCISRPFSQISCSMAFDEKGNVTKIGKASLKAPGVGAAGAAEALAGQAVAADEAIRAAREKREGAEAKEMEDQLKLLELEKKIKDAQAALQVAAPSEREQIEQQILELDTERRLLEAQRLLDEERAMAIAG